MIESAPRVAFFTDSFHEVNGVALTSRQLEGFARRRRYPFFSAHTGQETRVWQEESVTRCELALSGSSFALETDLRFDLRFLRHRASVVEALRRFQPDLVHVTGPSHVGILGVIAARVERSLFALVPLGADDWQAARTAYAEFALERLPAEGVAA